LKKDISLCSCGEDTFGLKKNHFSFFSTIKQAELAFVDLGVPFSQMFLFHPKSEE
jgi:hypothetical protein